MKRFRTILLLTALCVLACALCISAGAAALYIDEDGSMLYQPKEITPVDIYCGEMRMQSDIPAYVVDGRTMVPVRLIAETLGAEVEWIGSTRQVRITLGGREILLTIGSAVALVDGVETALYSGIPAVIAHDGTTKRTMVPLRFVAEQLGASAEWDSERKAAVITPAGEPCAAITAVSEMESEVVIAYSGVCVPSVFTLSEPNRLVVDLLGGELAGSVQRKYAVNSELIAAVRTNQYDRGYEGFDRVARIVFDLADGIAPEELTVDASVHGVVRVSAAAEMPEEAPEETPEEVPAPAPEEEPEKNLEEETEQTPKPVVVIDAGHGGSDPGTQATDLDEKEINLEVALQVGAILEAAGVEVHLTRTSDVYVMLADRVGLANDLGADIFVSIHSNASSSSTALHGIETYYLAGKTESVPLARALHESVLAATGARDNNVRTGDYFLMRETKMPAALVEMGYVTNPAELAQLRLSSYRMQLAEGIAAGIMSYLRSTGLL